MWLLCGASVDIEFGECPTESTSFGKRGAAVAGTCRNTEAAAVSLPSQLRRETAVDRDRWLWRTPLEKSQPFW